MGRLSTRLSSRAWVSESIQCRSSKTRSRGCSWLSRSSTRLRASRVRWRRWGGSSCQEGLSSGKASSSASRAGSVSWRVSSSVSTCPVTLARMVRVSSLSSTWP